MQVQTLVLSKQNDVKQLLATIYLQYSLTLKILSCCSVQLWSQEAFVTGGQITSCHEDSIKVGMIDLVDVTKVNFKILVKFLYKKLFNN